MSDGYIHTGSVDNLLSTYFVRKALPRLVARQLFYELAPQKTPLPKGEGKVVKFNRWINFNPVSTTLSESAGNSLSTISAVTISATISMYGRGVKPTELIIDTASLPVVSDLVENLGDSAGISVDKVIQLGIFKNSLVQNGNAESLSAWMSAVVSAFYRGTNTTYSDQKWGFPVVIGSTATRLSNTRHTSGTTAPSTSSVFSVYSLGKALKELKAQNCLPFADGQYKAICNTDAADDMMRDPEYKDWNQKFQQGVEKFEKGMVGNVKRCKIYESNNIIDYTGAGTPKHSVNLVFVFGQGAYGVTELGGGNGKGFEIIVKRPNQYDTNNPFNTFSTLTYRFAMVGKALNVSCGRILLVNNTK